MLGLVGPSVLFKFYLQPARYNAKPLLGNSMHLANAYMVAVVAMACCSRDDILDLDESEPAAAFASHTKAHGLGSLVEQFNAYTAEKAAAAGA